MPTLSDNILCLSTASNITKIYVPAGMKDSYNTGNWEANYYAKIEEVA